MAQNKLSIDGTVNGIYNLERIFHNLFGWVMRILNMEISSAGNVTVFKRAANVWTFLLDILPPYFFRTIGQTFKAARPSEKSVNFYGIIWCHITENIFFMYCLNM